MVFNSPCLTDKKEFIHHEGTALVYVVPTGRVVDSTGRYVVPAGKVIIIVSPGRLNLVPTGRILSPGGFVDKFVRDPNKTPDSSQRPPQNYPKCGNPVDGLYCRQCALLRKKLKEVWSTICYEDEIFQDFLNTSESSNDKTNVVNAPQEPFVFNQDPGENSSQRPPHIDHHCCYGCGDSLDVVNLDTYTPEPLQWRKIPICYDEDDDEESSIPLRDIIIYGLPPCIAITPVLSTEEPDNSLSIGDEHLDTILATKSDEVIKSSVENLVPIPSESEDFSDIKSECDDSQTKKISTFSNPLFDDSTSSDDESSHEEVIHEISFKTYSDLEEEIISSEFNPIHNEDLDSTPKNDRFDTESYLLESLLNRDTLMASSPKIDSLLDEFAGELITIPPRIVRKNEEYISMMERLLYDNSSPRPPEDFHANPNTIIESLPTFPILLEDKGDDNSTSLPEFESFHVDYSDSGDSTIDVVEDIPVDVPNILPTHPTLHMDSDFISSHNDLGSDLDVSSPSGDRNKIYDPGICIEVESTRITATLSPVIDTLHPFSSENDEKVFNHGVLASKEKSPPSSSHQGFKASKLFHHKSPMLIHGEDIRVLDVPCLHFYPP
ncbi:hypothetical protein Tco_0122590 [Tanacetum coccineum]